MAASFHYSAAFMASARQLSHSNPSAWAGLRAAINYLQEFSREAVAPDVRWNISQSDFGQHCGEIRWPDPEDQASHPDTALRGQFVAHPNNDWYVFTVVGNKAGGTSPGNAWYGPTVRQSDQIGHQAVEALGLTPFPTK